MNVQHFFKCGIAVAVVALSACSEQKQNQNANNNEAKPVAELTTSTASSFAYINVDSLSLKYQYCIDATALLESKLKTYQSTATQKQTALQQAQQNLQKKLQEGAITSEEQYKSEMEKLAKQEQSFVQYCQQQEQMLEMERAQILASLADSLNNYLPEYNKAKKYTMILNNAVILHSDGVVDITGEVISGLNKRYSKK